MSLSVTLVSHALCPYVQRIAIALSEKGVAQEGVTVDLASKPGWFLALSPLGRTPVLKVGEAALFESAEILEFLEDTLPDPLHPADTFDRIGDFGVFDGLARMSAWCRELGDRPSVRNAVAPAYPDRLAAFLRRKTSALTRMIEQSCTALWQSA